MRVVRVRRAADTNHIRQLDNRKVAELWNDPLLRYSNILDGLFHEKVVVCEGDADARFYSAVADALFERKELGDRRPDVMFTHCGGKDRCPMVIRSLREVDVPVAVAVDLDALNAEQPLRAIVEASGGAWATVERDWRIVKAAVDSKKPELDAKDVKDEIAKIVGSVTTSAFPDTATDSIKTLLRRSSPWSLAKSVGTSFVPSGDPTQALDRLLIALRGMGVHVVEVGEVEGFARSVGNHGPKWVNEALKKNLMQDIELEQARRFVARLLA